MLSRDKMTQEFFRGCMASDRNVYVACQPCGEAHEGGYTLQQHW